MKQFKLFAALFAVCFSFLFTSCNNNNEEVYASIVGTWNAVKMEYLVNDVLEGSTNFADEDVSLIYTFSEYEKYTSLTIENGETDTYAGIYNISEDNKILTLLDSEGEVNIIFFIKKATEKELVLDNTDTTMDGKFSSVYYFTRQ